MTLNKFKIKQWSLSVAVPLTSSLCSSERKPGPCRGVVKLLFSFFGEYLFTEVKLFSKLMGFCVLVGSN